MAETNTLSAVAQRVAKVARALHAGAGYIEAANAFQTDIGVRRVDNEVDALDVLNELLAWLLRNDRFDLAAQMLWTPVQFTADPESVRTIWREIATNETTLLMGGSSMGKSYTPGVRFLLEWLADPAWTSVRVVGPTEEHLTTNLFSHLTALHREASIPLPGVCRDLFIGLDMKRREGGILGVVIPQGASRAAGRLQGSKRRPRPHPHPKYGPLSRLLLLIDELENVPPAIYTDLENIVANVQSADDPGFRVVASWNPKDRTRKPYTLAEPITGWDSFDIEKHYVWTSRRGYRVVRLDGARSENVIAGRVVYPGLQTAAGYARTAAVAGGVESPGWYTFCRGCYPPTGGSHTLLNREQLAQRIGTPIWIDAPRPVAGVDLALGGGASVPFSRGLFGRASGVRLPGGAIVQFRDRSGRPESRPCIFADALEHLPTGKTLDVARSVRTTAEANRVEPEWLELDRTGNGAGVHDLLTTLWNEAVGGTNYSEAATDRKILVEDRGTAKELYGRVVSELWFAVQKFVVHGFLWFSPALDREELFAQLTSRRYNPHDRDRVESKSDYMSRGFASPDDADGLTLMVHAVRRASGAQFSFSGSTALDGAGGSGAMTPSAEDDVGPVEADRTQEIQCLDE